MIVERPSPFGAARQTPKRIIVHAMAEYLDMDDDGIMEAVDFLRHVGLSAHVLVKPNGDIVKCREDTQGAYHAKGFNMDSLGIEFLVPGVDTYGEFIERIKTPWVSEVQLLSGARVIAEWIARWGITQIDGHCDIDPDRKSDPGAGFDWDGLRAAL